MVKNFFTLVLMLVAAITVDAQNERVTQVRQLYAEAQQKMAQYKDLKEVGHPGNNIEVTSNHMAAGAGPIHEVIRYFFDGDYDEVRDCDFFTLYFVTRTYNVGAIKYYEEILYDHESEPCFYYGHREDGQEVRYYWNRAELAHQIVKGELVVDPGNAIHTAKRLWVAFNSLRNEN